MSLTRITSIEGRDRSREPSPAPSLNSRRKMSFNPVDDWVSPEIEHPAIPAFEISQTRRLLQVITAVVYCLFAAGVVFGYAAIKPVLLKEGAYRGLCSQEELDSGEPVCFAQEIR